MEFAMPIKRKAIGAGLLSLLAALACVAAPAEYYVSKKGSDTNPGSHEQPFASISKAAEVMRPGDTCLIGDGVYSETIRPARSGTADLPIQFRKLNPDGRVIIFGLDRIPRNNWVRESEKIYRTRVHMNLGPENQLFLQDKMLFEARWPNTGPVLLEPTLATMEKGTGEELIVDPNLPDYNYSGAEVWIHAPRHWSNWTTRVAGSPGPGSLEIINSAPFKGSTSWHVARKGAKYYIFGIKDALDADNEWYFDKRKGSLFIHRSDGELPAGDYYYKSRMVGIDVRGRSHTQFEGLEVIGASIVTDADSDSLEFSRMKLLYPYFSSRAEGSTAQSDKGIRLMGRNCTIRDSEIAYSSGTGVALFGENNRVINCYIHDNDFIGTYASCVQLGGKGNVISHSTLTRSGRSLIDYGKMYQSLIQHCELSYGGMLTSDLGLTYGNIIEGGNSVLRYNVLRDNQGNSHCNGLYFDHGTQNIISHNNIVYGIKNAAFMINHYGAYHLVYNNTFISEKYGFRNMWGNKFKPELNGVRFVNNVFAKNCDTNALGFHWSYNVVNYDRFDRTDPYRPDPQLMGKGRYIEGISTVPAGVQPGLGAIEAVDIPFTVGHDFENPPQSIDVRLSKPLHRNLVVNAAFEHEDFLSPWKFSGKGKAVTHKFQSQIMEDNNLGRAGQRSVELMEEGSEVSQEINGLEPNATYRFIGFIRIEKGESAVTGIRYPDGQEFLSTLVDSSFFQWKPGWRRVDVSFDTSDTVTGVTVFARRTSKNGGTVHFDDAGLILESRH
jgi:hypothetical protein